MLSQKKKKKKKKYEAETEYDQSFWTANQSYLKSNQAWKHVEGPCRMICVEKKSWFDSLNAPESVGDLKYDSKWNEWSDEENQRSERGRCDAEPRVADESREFLSLLPVFTFLSLLAIIAFKGSLHHR